MRNMLRRWLGVGPAGRVGPQGERGVSVSDEVLAEIGMLQQKFDALANMLGIVIVADCTRNPPEALEQLRVGGSVAVPGYMHPEGIVVYHSASRSLFKQMIENDDVPKSKAEKGPRKPRDPNVGGRRKGLDPNYVGPERRAQ